MTSINKIQKKESLFYTILSSIILLGFSGYLILRLIRHLMIGPVVLTIYFIVLAFFVPLLTFAVKKSNKARYVLIEFGIIILLFFMFDISLRIIDFPHASDSKYARARYNRMKALMSLREKGFKAMPFIPPGTMGQFSKDYGIDLYLSNIGNSYIIGEEEDDGLIVFKTDSIGFRNETGLYENNESFDIFLLGDSFAQGSWVPDGFTIPDYIRKEINLSVYNAGYSGTGLITQLAIFLEYGLRKKPKNVVLLYNEAVFLNRALVELENNILKRYFEDFESNDILAKNSVKDEQLKTIIETEYLKLVLGYMEEDLRKGGKEFSLKKYIYDSKILLLIQRLMQNYRGEGYPDCEKVKVSRNIVKRVFRRYKQETEKYGGKFWVVFLADTRFFFKRWPDCEYKMVSSICNHLDIPFVDTVKVFNKFENPKDFFASNPYVSTIGGHCNRKGYELVAKEIVRQLRNSRN